MKEGISELKEIFRGKYEKKVPYTEKYLRKVSVYLTWILLHTDLSANQATVIMIIFGILSGIFFCLGTKLMTLSGALVLLIWYFFDLIDGEIAEYRKTCSTTGSYFDGISHYIVHPYVLFCLGIGLYRRFDYGCAFFLGYVSSLSYILLEIAGDLRYKYIFTSRAQSHIPTLVNKSLSGNVQEKEESMLIKLIKMYCLFPGVMDLIIISSIIDFLIGDIVIFNIRLTVLGLLLISYGIFYPLSFARGLYRVVKNKELDKLLP